MSGRARRQGRARHRRRLGIGEATALAFEAAGASVVAMSPEGLDERDAVAAAVGDVRSRDDVAVAVALARERFGGLDVVVANAAVSIYEEFEYESEETIDLILGTNLKGALLCAQLAIPELKRRGGGSIVFVSSVQAFLALPGCVPYAARRPGSWRLRARSRPRSGGTASA